METLLPPELLSYVFEFGAADESEEDTTDETAVEEDDGDDNFEDVDSEEDSDEDDIAAEEDGAAALSLEGKKLDTLPLQVLVSHVCRRWRKVALDKPKLWRVLDFESYPIGLMEVYLSRTAETTLAIRFDNSLPNIWFENFSEALAYCGGEDIPLDQFDDPHHGSDLKLLANMYSDLNRFLDLVLPHVTRWQKFFFNTSFRHHLEAVTHKLAAVKNGAPELQCLELHIYKEPSVAGRAVEDNNVLILGASAPKLDVFTLTDNCVDMSILIPALERSTHFDGSRLPMQSSNLTTLELDHSGRTGMSYENFAKILHCATGIHTISLSNSGPELLSNTIVAPLFLRNLRILALGMMPQDYTRKLLPLFYAPGLTTLTLDFEEEDGDFTRFVDQLTSPMSPPINPPPGFSKPIHLSEINRYVDPSRPASLIANLTGLRISGLPCDGGSQEKLYRACQRVRRLFLNMHFLPAGFAFALYLNNALKAGSPSFKKLEELTVSGFDAKGIIDLAYLRKASGLRLKRLRIDEDTVISEKQLRKLRKVVQDVELVEISDNETDDEDEDDSDEEGDDEDEDEDEDGEDHDIGDDHVADDGYETVEED